MSSIAQGWCSSQIRLVTGVTDTCAIFVAQTSTNLQLCMGEHLTALFPIRRDNRNCPNVPAHANGLAVTLRRKY